MGESATIQASTAGHAATVCQQLGMRLRKCVPRFVSKRRTTKVGSKISHVKDHKAHAGEACGAAVCDAAERF